MRFLFLIFLGFIGLPALAQDMIEETPEALLTLYRTGNSDYQKMRSEEILRLYALLQPECTPEDILTKPLDPVITEAPQFLKKIPRDSDGNLQKDDVTVFPSGGQWIERSLVKGCQDDTPPIRLNFVATAYDPEALPVLYPIVNGETKIESELQTLTERAIQNLLSGAPVYCQSMPFVKNTVFIGYRSQDKTGLAQDDQNRGWFERWDVTACRKDFTINLAVLPDRRARYRFVPKIAE